MTTILVVDDNASNRFIVETLLDEYAQKNGEDFCIHSACNGSEAIDLCKMMEYDLILMDIMMPVLDGIEATKKITLQFPKAMIVAVSAADDSANEDKMILSGAKDYIHKPINPEIFCARLNNYISLIKHRKSRQLKTTGNTINCINSNTLTRKTNFYIDSEDAFLEFWEYCLTNDMNTKEWLDLIRMINAIVNDVLPRSIYPDIWVEYTESSTYITVCGPLEIESEKLNKYLQKSISGLMFKNLSDRFSVAIAKKQPTEAEMKSDHDDISEVKSRVEQIPVVAETSKEEPSTAKIKQVYKYMDEDDLADIKDYLSKLNSLLMIVSKGDIEVEEISEISAYLEKMGKIITTYPESFPIGMALNDLSFEITNHSTEFQKKSLALGEMCIAFGQDIAEWIRLIFEEGSESVNSMDESIIFNAVLLAQMLKDAPREQNTIGLDDIFF